MNKSSITPITKDQVFSRVPKNDAIMYSTFDRSHRNTITHNEDFLIPILVDEVYPGDIFTCNVNHLSRLLTPIHPFFDEIQGSCQFFYVQNRLVWDNLKPFFGENRRNDENYSPDNYQVPMLNSGAVGVAVGSIFDYAGIPPLVPNLEFSALPFRAMNLIYNEWYRDENLCDWLNVGGSNDVNGDYDVDTEFGDSDQLSNYSLFKRAKQHDYFTSALPFQQKGTPQSISIGTSAPVIGNNMSIGLTNGTLNAALASGSRGQDGVDKWLGTAKSAYGSNVGTAVTLNGTDDFDTNVTLGLTSDGTKSGIIADLTNVTGFTIADLRVATQLQMLKELDARVGTRYKEMIYGHFNVTVSDATLDRPEFLGGYNFNFSIIPVANTTGTSEDPQGNLSAFGVASSLGNRAFKKAFEEHGFVIGFMCIRSTQTYTQGLERFWSRKNKYDFYDPLLANLSEQAIKMKEIYAQGANVLQADGVTPVDEKTFGYQEAWAELRYKPNRACGLMRPQVPSSLSSWNLIQELSPSVDSKTNENLGIPLNQDFIELNSPISRVVAVQNQPHFYSDMWFDLKCTRELPLYSVPSFIVGRM